MVLLAERLLVEGFDVDLIEIFWGVDVPLRASGLACF
jgi:hypothetical protein